MLADVWTCAHSICFSCHAIKPTQLIFWNSFPFCLPVVLSNSPFFSLYFCRIFFFYSLFHSSNSKCLQLLFQSSLNCPVLSSNCFMSSSHIHLGMGARRHGQGGHLPPLEMLKSVFLLQTLCKTSVDEVFMHHFEKMSSASGGLPHTPTGELPLDPAGRLPPFRPPHCPPLEKFLRAPTHLGLLCTFTIRFTLQHA